MNEISHFLQTSPIFRELSPEQIEEIAPLFQEAHYPAGAIILKHGEHSASLYLLRSGRVAARIQRESTRETIAYLQPPDAFGELSFLTGRPCVCDVEVVVDADVVVLSKAEAAKLTSNRESILRSLMDVIASRLQETVARGAKAPESPVLLLKNMERWEAPRAFADTLARSLARLTQRETLLVSVGEGGEGQIARIADHVAVCELPLKIVDGEFRSFIAHKLTEWKRSYENVIFNLTPIAGSTAFDVIDEFTNWEGTLLGPGDPLPDTIKNEAAPSEAVPGGHASRFVVQSAVNSSLPWLSGSRQLIPEAAQAEDAHRNGGKVPLGFQRVVDSIARCITGLQIGLALGGGAAWGWAHIGVLDVFERAGIPIDMISGCSMGSVIGALRCAGFTTQELREIAEYWKTRTKRFIEWRFWRMSLLNEKKVRKAFRQYFGARAVNQTAIPYWANAVDIQTGKEFTLRSGSLVQCVRASISLPGLIPPVVENSHLLVDAGIMDPVPVPLVRNMGCHFAIGVNAMAALETQRVNNRYPFNAFDIMTRCMFVMGHEIGQARAEQSANIVFTPALGDIGMLQFSRSRETIECGRKAAEENLPSILASYDRLKLRNIAPRQ